MNLNPNMIKKVSTGLSVVAGVASLVAGMLEDKKNELILDSKITEKLAEALKNK